MQSKHQPIEELDFFIIFEGVADWAWKTSSKWPPYIRDNFGVQLTDAADSVGANLVEGDGRFGSADGIRFLIIARASARETKLWIQRAVRRTLVTEVDGERQVSEVIRATKLLNLLINYRRSAFKKVVREGRAPYGEVTADEVLESVIP